MPNHKLYSQDLLHRLQNKGGEFNTQTDGLSNEEGISPHRLAKKAQSDDYQSWPHIGLDNPLCGDHCELWVQFASTGHILKIYHRTEGCKLCMAAADILVNLGNHIKNSQQAQSLFLNLNKFLKNGDQYIDIPNELYVFSSLKDFPNRHNCVLLPFESLVKLYAQEGF